MRFFLAPLLILTICQTALGQPAGEQTTNQISNREPAPEEAPAPTFSKEVCGRVASAVVVIETIDKDGNFMSSASAFVDSRGFVVTNRHCIEGASAVRLNLGAAGLFDLPTLVAESRDLDVVFLQGEYPADAVTRLEWAVSTPTKQSPVCVGVRNYLGRIRFTSGWSKGFDFEHGGQLVLDTTCPAWLGTSGSPLFDIQGKVIGVVSRLGWPSKGSLRTTASAAPCTDIARMATDHPIALGAWDGADRDPQGRRFRYLWENAKHYSDTNSSHAIKFLREALGIRPNHMQASIALMDELRASGRYSDAIDVAKKLSNALPNEPEPRLHLGHFYYERGEYSDAILAYRDATNAKPLAAAWYYLGTAQCANGDLTAGALSLEQAVLLEPRHTESWRQLAAAYRLLDKSEEVANVMRRQLVLEPDNAELMEGLAEAAQRSGKAQESAEVLKRLRELNPYLANRREIPKYQEPVATPTQDSAPVPGR